MRSLILFLFLFLILLPGSTGYSWGFFGHRLINRSAVFCLPGSMIGFYKSNIRYIEEHATDPDNRRYIDPEEPPRHFIDLDRYEGDTLPVYWNKACEKFTEDTLKEHGIVPWHIQRMYHRLVKAFVSKDHSFILRTSADLGHYIADAHVPLHTTSNYNGQKTDQKGIHGFWESRLPELFSEEYDLFTGRAVYIENIAQFAWDIVHDSFSMKDSVLKIEKALNQKTPSALQYTFERRGEQEIKTYSVHYSREYSNALNGMVERRMRTAILSVSSVWYSAWVDAGQPDLLMEPVTEIFADTLKKAGPVKLTGHED